MVNSIVNIFLLFFIQIVTHSASLNLKADQTLIPMGGEVEVQFIFEGLSSSPNLGSLDIEGFHTIARSTSTSVQFINGKKSESATITLQLRPKTTGRLTIGPYELTYNKQKLRSNQLVIIVDSSALNKSNKKSIFIEASLDKKVLVSGEQTLYRVKIYRPADKTNFSQMSFSLPDTSDVILEEKKSTQKDYQKNIKGKLHQVTEVIIPLFALKSGSFNIPPASVTYYIKSATQRRRRRSFFDSFFDDNLFGGRGTKKQAWSEGLKLEVDEIKLLKPKNFSGLIGQFNIEQTLSHKDITTDDSLTLKLKVTGIGNLNDLREILVEIEGFKIYPDGEGDLQERKGQNGLLGGIKEFSYALVPNKAKSAKIGPFKLTYFDSDKKIFSTVETIVDIVNIKQGELKPQTKLVMPVTDKKVSLNNENKLKVKVLKHNILPLEMTYDTKSSFLLNRSHFLVFSLLLILLTLIFDFFIKNKLNFKKHGIELDYNQAWVIFTKEIEVSNSPSKVFTDFLLRKLKSPVLEKTKEEILEILMNKSISQDLYEKTFKIYEKEDINKYSGQNAQQSDINDWINLSKTFNDEF
ncbi:MAG: hypothetical protein COB02_04710 [Candidatus Cloacimonadota bacterium]|nr:MAG: hypothetical protein COB02_04710 [Candidatus Cloacimonadota bacterium]